jgi:hypothetical protein
VAENTPGVNPQPETEARPPSLGDEILEILEKKCENPGQAFVILQQLSIFVWDQYKIDWSQAEGQAPQTTRKQRYLDYVMNLVDTLQANNALVQKID